MANIREMIPRPHTATNISIYSRSTRLLVHMKFLIDGSILPMIRSHTEIHCKFCYISIFLLFAFQFNLYLTMTTFNPFPNKSWFLRVCSTSLLKTLWQKKKLLVTSSFSFSHSVFYYIRELSRICLKSKIVVCKLFQYGRV